jgi:hypothetical protein
VPEGLAAAYLVLISMLLLRLPAWLSASRSPGPAAGGAPLRWMLAAALAGAAPFVGFPARMLALTATSQRGWPLALALAAGLLLWIPPSFGLARSAATRGGGLGLALPLGAGCLLGVLPGAFLRLGGL